VTSDISISITIVVLAALSLGAVSVFSLALWRRLSEEQAARTAAIIKATELLTERATREEVRDIVTRAYEDIYLPKLKDELRGLLPADVTPAMVLETLERIGVRIPDPAPELPDEELLRKVRGWCTEGIYLAEEAARQNKKRGFLLEPADKRRIALDYVRKNISEERLTFDGQRLVLEFELVFAQFARGELTPPVGPASDPRAVEPARAVEPSPS
jgi:hypothetical protein